MAAERAKSDGARGRVVELLQRAGIPLEVQVAGVCREFCRRHDGINQVRVTTERVVYGEERSSKPAREVDQSVQFDRDLELAEHLGVRLRLRVPVECKHRRGLEAYGFPRRRDERLAALPVVSDHAGAVLVNQLAYIEPAIIRSRRECALTLLSIEGKASDRVHEERLVENSGGAIYDFVRTVEANPVHRGVDGLAVEMGLLERLRDYVEPDALWWGRFRRFVRSLPGSTFDEFNRRRVQGRRLLVEVSLHVPVVCSDAPLYVVPCTRRGRIQKFLPTNVLMTGLRLGRWPGRLRYDLARQRPEAMVLMTNVIGVGDLLASCFEWYSEMLEVLAHSEATVINRALLEGALYRSVGAVVMKNMRPRRRGR